MRDIVIGILTNFLYQILFTVGAVVVFGLLIALCRRIFCSIVGPAGAVILLVSGIVGTPIHELSHALMCLLFGHKVVEIKLFQPGSDDGMLGYVDHSYNPKNLYHQIGNFFIGTAPIICGSGLLLLLMYLLVPDVFAEASVSLDAINTLEGLDITKIFGAIFGVLLSVLDFSNMSNGMWWLFIVLAFMISSHMELSFADIKGGFIGFLYISLILIIVDLIVGFISLDALGAVTGAFATAGFYIAGFLTISLVFSLLLLIIALILRVIGVGR